MSGRSTQPPDLSRRITETVSEGSVVVVVVEEEEKEVVLVVAREANLRRRSE